MTIQEILEAHTQSIRNGRCSCEDRGPKRTGLEHNAHLAEVLDKHMQERILAWQEQAWEACDDAWKHAHSLDNIEPWGYLPDNPYKEQS